MEKKIDGIKIRFMGKLKLPLKIQNKINDNWRKLSAEGKNLFRGKVFVVRKISKKVGLVEIETLETDYAHYAFKNNLSRKFSCRNIYTACLIETADGYFVFGKMGKQNFRAGKIQCVGGGLDEKDLFGKKIDPYHNIIKEIEEEIGLRIKRENLRFCFLENNEKEKKVALVFLVKVEFSRQEFERKYQDFKMGLKKKKIWPEFSRLFFIKKDLKSLDKFSSQYGKNSGVFFAEKFLLLTEKPRCVRN